MEETGYKSFFNIFSFSLLVKKKIGPSPNNNNNCIKKVRSYNLYRGSAERPGCHIVNYIGYRATLALNAKKKIVAGINWNESNGMM